MKYGIGLWRAFRWLKSPCRLLRSELGCVVQRWSVMLAMVLPPVFFTIGLVATYNADESAKLTCAICGLGSLLACLPAIMQMDGIEE